MSVHPSHFWIPSGFRITAPAQPSATGLSCIWPGFILCFFIDSFNLPSVFQSYNHHFCFLGNPSPDRLRAIVFNQMIHTNNLLTTESLPLQEEIWLWATLMFLTFWNCAKDSKWRISFLLKSTLVDPSIKKPYKNVDKIVTTTSIWRCYWAFQHDLSLITNLSNRLRNE